jgi:hypothetical protein
MISFKTEVGSIIIKKSIMKKLTVYSILIFWVLAACQNQPVEFPDYDLKAVYFPYQRPLRTLSMGEDRIDNSMDKEGKFDIGVSIGGMYQNRWDWTVDYVLDVSLTNDVYTNTNPPLKIVPLPSQYYTLNPTNKVTIPKGLYNGLIRVQLTDAFFNDPLAVTGLYVIPLRLTATSADSILQGKPAISNADPRILSHWESNRSPKNWVMFGIKYVNPYHGTYLHRGRIIRVNKSTGNPVDTVVFRNKYVEQDLLIRMSTIGRRKVVSNGLGNRTGGDFAMTLEFANDKGSPGAITITSAEGSNFTVTGTGQYFDKASSTQQWTGMTWQSMYLNYTWQDATHTHHVLDTLVFRDRGIKFEENAIQIIK